jgi:peptidyl-prolyl cis-trans isomerase C
LDFDQYNLMGLVMGFSRPRSSFRILVPGVVLLGLAAGQAWGQTDPKNGPSPVAPGDLSKPVFDTTTPSYDSVPSLAKAASTVVAEVEGRPITMGDVGDAIRALPPSMSQLPFESLYPGILDQLIKTQALVVRAQQQGVDEEPAVRRKVKEAADLRLAEEYVEREVSGTITEQALLDRYNRDIAGHPGPDEVRVRVILTDTEKAAVDAIAELKGGADFATVARRISRDTTAPAGGDLGFHALDGMNPEVGAVAFMLPVGQMTPNPVRAAAGWFVIRVEERRQQPTPAFASVREQLRQILMREAAVPLAEAAMKDLKIRRYSIAGGESEADKSPDKSPARPGSP